MLACSEMNDMHNYTLEHDTAKGLTFMSVKAPMFIILFFSFLFFPFLARCCSVDSQQASREKCNWTGIAHKASSEHRVSSV
jgi:hypothetical protein